MDFSAEETLRYMVEKGIIDKSSIQSCMENEHRKCILEQHKGNIWQDSKGRYNTYLGSGRKNRKRITRNTHEELVDALVDYYSKGGKPTLKTVFEQAYGLKVEKNKISPSSYDRYENHFIRFITNNEYAKKIKNIPICDITEKMLDELIYNTFENTSYKAKAYSDFKTVITGIFKYAYKNELTKIDIVTYLKLICTDGMQLNRDQKPVENRFFSPTERRLVKEYLTNNEDIRNLGLLLLFYTGLRIGELSGLKKSAITCDFANIENSEVHNKVNVGGVRKNRVYISNKTKTSAGNRGVCLNNDAKRIAEKIMLLSDSDEWLFSENGKIINTHSFRKRLYSVCDELGIPQKSPHSIRRDYATVLHRNNVSDDIVKVEMGHANIETTRRNYFNPYYDNEEIKEGLKNVDFN